MSLTRIFIYFNIVLVILLVTLFFFKDAIEMYWYSHQKVKQEKYIFIPTGANLLTVTDLLEREKIIDKLNGMFAFVIFDPSRNCLFGARDRVGIKPFYYTLSPNHFAFSSEMKSLCALPFVEKNINFQSLSHYLTFQFVPPPKQTKMKS